METLQSVTPGTAPWYVVRVKPNTERRVAQSLIGRELGVFLPLQKRLSRRKNIGMIEIPLFPGYVFSNFESRSTLAVVTCPGVLSVLSCQGSPQPVDPSEMYALQVLSVSATSLAPYPSFIQGQKVRIQRGPLTGVEGVIIRDNGRHRLIVSVVLLQRSVIAEVEREWLETPSHPIAISRWQPDARASV
jgi:transcription antitermination factor NusG